MANTEVLAHIDRNDTVELLRQMIRIKTVNDPGDEKPLADFLAGEMASGGLSAAVVDLGGNRANVVGKMQGAGRRPALLLNGHLDTVPPGDVQWTHGPYSADIVDGRIYGRGSADMKSGVAGMIAAAKAVRAAGLPLEGDLIFAGTAGEEVDSVGAIHFLNEGGLKDVGAIIIGEPSSCGINIAEKGALWVEVATYGKTAHGAFPDRGVNAIVHMNAVIAELLDYKYAYEENALLGHPTMNVATIHGGVKTNVVPDKCSLTLDLRTVPGTAHDELVTDLEGILGGLKGRISGFQASLRVLNNRPPVETDAAHPFVRMAQAAAAEEFGKRLEVRGVNFYTDAAVFLPATRLPAIFYGPGDAEMAHQPDEHVTIDSLMEATHFYAAMIERYLVA
jgi:succinyl-diaminopimelate desuccinylase